MPLGSNELLQPAVMINLFGEHWQAGAPDWPGLMRIPGARLNLYGKRPTRPQCKMGHVTCVAPTLDVDLRLARAADKLLGGRSARAAS